MKTLLCKGCTENITVTDQFLEDMLLHAKKSGKNFVSTEIFEERIRMCNHCSALQYGTTCMHSGSLIQYRAKLADSNCPSPHGAKW